MRFVLDPMKSSVHPLSMVIDNELKTLKGDSIKIWKRRRGQNSELNDALDKENISLLPLIGRKLGWKNVLINCLIVLRIYDYE